MVRQKRFRYLLIVLVLMAIFTGGFLVYNHGRPLQVPENERLFPGIDYSRKVQLSPRPMIIHLIKIDTHKSKLRFLVTPPDNMGSQYPLRARTTSQFLQEFGVQIAVLMVMVSRPGGRAAQRIIILMWAILSGHGAMRFQVAESTGLSDAPVPTLYISKHNQMSFIAPGKPFNAISGGRMLVKGGDPIPGLDNITAQPRTAIGYSNSGRYLYLVVVDGRQPLYSEGITLSELANLMISLGAQYAMNLDGGGSSTMVVEGKDGQPRILNSPIDNYIPGRERPVADHLGIYVTK